MVQEIIYLFPNTIIGVDIVFEDDGQGVFIKEWNLQTPQPTQAEIDAVSLVVASREAIKLKWIQIDEQQKSLTVTVQPSGNIFAANKTAAEAMFHKSSIMASGETCNWYEDWGTFVTNKIELQEAHTLADQAYQALIDSIMGA